MQFLYPKILWALSALAIPVIIHLFNFRRYKTVYFSNVAFLQNIRKEVKSRSTLKNLLILLLRLIAIASIVLVFAHPYIPVGQNTKIAKIPYVAVYIDNSFSMDAEGKHGILLESAKVKAKELTTALPGNTRYLLITNEFALLHQRYVSSDQFVDWVSQIQSCHIVRSFNDVMQKASALLPHLDSGVINTIYLLSDFQKNIVGSLPLKVPKNLNVIALPFSGQENTNLYIDSLWFESPDHYKGKLENLHITIRNNSTEDFNDIPLQLTINDSLRSSQVFNITANEKVEKIVPFTQWEPGLIEGHVDITDYPITFDNTLYFNYTLNEKIPVLIINESGNNDYFSALYSDDENIQAVSVQSTNIPYNKLESYQLIIVNQLQNLSSGLINELYQFMKKGGSLIFIPGINSDDPGYQSFYKLLPGITLGNILEQEGTISHIDWKSDLLKTAVNADLSDVKYPSYKKIYPVQIGVRSTGKSILADQSGNPVLVRIPVKSGKCYLSTIPLDPDITDFGTHPLFVPLFYNMALFASTSSKNFSWIKPGVVCKIKRMSKDGISLRLLEKSTGKELIPPYHVMQDEILINPDINSLSAGSFGVYSGSNLVDYLSFNYDRSESDLRCYSSDEIPELFGITPSKVIKVFDPFSQETDRQINQQNQGKPLVTWFIWLALFALLVEMLILRFLR